MRRAHREATEHVGANRLGRNEMRHHVHQGGLDEHAMETRPGVPQNEGNGLMFDRTCLKQDHVHREGSGVPQNGGNGPPTAETGVLLMGKCVAYRQTEETDLLRSKQGSC